MNNFRFPHGRAEWTVILAIMFVAFMVKMHVLGRMRGT